MYVKSNTEERSCNHCCSGEVIRITQSVCVFVALVIQRVMRMRHNLICGMTSSAGFFLLIS
jgi:hypothetical protein